MVEPAFYPAQEQAGFTGRALFPNRLDHSRYLRIPLAQAQRVATIEGSEMTLRIAVIADQGQLQKFAIHALDQICGCEEITVFSCENTRIRRRMLKHGAYYGLNLLSVRNPLRRSVPVASGRKRVTESVFFDSLYDGAWQILPDEIVDRLANSGFDVVLKFGMSLMRVPSAERLSVPILSYHHGDPDHYRGRPAGFYEILDKAPAVGQTVQLLSNVLDGGAVVAFAETKVHRHSYRATLVEAYRHSPLIINEAIANAIAGKTIPKSSRGRNYRLPSNWLVAQFLFRMATAFMARLFYGAFVEKSWSVSTAPLDPAALATGGMPPRRQWTTLQRPPGYAFIADPFFNPSGAGVLVEALDRRSATGEILLIEGSNWRELTRSGRHHSFPGTAEEQGETYIVPEVAEWSSPRIYRMGNEGLTEVAALKVEGNPRITDPVLFRHRGHLYLFGNNTEQGSGVLSLWTGTSLFDQFRLHPRSPIRISPLGSRMAGALVLDAGVLWRFGQDFTGAYGNGIFTFRVKEIGPHSYSEDLHRKIRLEGVKGPHTLNIRSGQAVFDWYVDTLSPLAWARRLRQERRLRAPA